MFKCESGYNPKAVGDGHLTFTQGGVTYGYSVGIAQIRILPGRPSSDWLMDLDNNLTYARRLYEAQGWTPWTCARNLGLTNPGKASNYGGI